MSENDNKERTFEKLSTLLGGAIPQIVTTSVKPNPNPEWGEVGYIITEDVVYTTSSKCVIGQLKSDYWKKLISSGETVYLTDQAVPNSEFRSQTLSKFPPKA